MILLDKCIDVRRPTNKVLEPCPDTEQYQQGLAIGEGLIQTNPDVAPRGLMEVVLHKYRTCSNYFIGQRLQMDDTKQVLSFLTLPLFNCPVDFRFAGFFLFPPPPSFIFFRKVVKKNKKKT